MLVTCGGRGPYLDQASRGHQGMQGVGSAQLPKVSGLSGSMTYWSGMTLNYVSQEVPGHLIPMGVSLLRHLRNT
jgi:hypothetical protein